MVKDSRNKGQEKNYGVYVKANKEINLSFDRGFIFLIFDGGTGLSIPFLFEKTIQKAIKLRTVFNFFFRSRIKDMDIFAIDR